MSNTEEIPEKISYQAPDSVSFYFLEGLLKLKILLKFILIDFKESLFLINLLIIFFQTADLSKADEINRFDNKLDDVNFEKNVS